MLGISTVRAVSGTRSLAMPVRFSPPLGLLNVRVTLCPDVNFMNLRGRRMSAQVFLAGPALPPGSHEVQLRALSANGTSLASMPAVPSIDRWQTLAFTLDSAAAETTFDLELAFSFALSTEWQGTLHVDDVRVD